jgi:6-pyruvoyl-tetrahydropterin synthase
MSEHLVAALIAGGVSLLVSGIGFLAALMQVRSNIRRVERELQHAYTNRLYDQRMKHYPEGFRIAGRIMQRRKPALLDPPETLGSIRDQLNEWAEGEAGLYLSGEALRAYWGLRDALSKKPGLGDQYAPEQAEKIWQARVAFRKQLRRDMGNLYGADQERRRRMRDARVRLPTGE